MSKEIKLILKECERRGYIIKFTSNHYRVHLPNHQMITVAGTPSDRNAFKQIIREFRRQGIMIKI